MENKIETSSSASAPQGAPGLLLDQLGWPQLEYNVDLVLNQMLGDFWRVGVVDKMMNDPQIAALMNLIFFVILGTKVVIEPASKDNRDLLIAKVVEELILKRSGHQSKRFHDLQSLPFGFVPFSVFFKPVQARIDGTSGQTWRSLIASPRRPASIYSWERDPETSKFVRARQQEDGSWYDLDLAQMQIVTFRSRWGSITGDSALRPLYGPYRDKAKTKILGLINMERFNGFPVVEGIKNIADKRAIESNLAAIRISEMAYLALADGQGTFRLESGAAGGSPQHLEMMRYCDDQMAQVFHASFLKLGTEGKGGAFALSKSLVDVFWTGLTFICRELEEAYNEDPANSSCPNFIKALVDENFRGVTQYPRYCITSPSQEDVERCAAILDATLKARSLSAADEQLVREKLGAWNEEIKQDLADRKKAEKEPEEMPEEIESKEEERAPAEDQLEEKEVEQSTSDCGCGCVHLAQGAFDAPLQLNRQPMGAERFINFSELDRQWKAASSAASAALEGFVMAAADRLAKRYAKPIAARDLKAILKIKISEKPEDAWAEVEPIYSKTRIAAKEALEKELQAQKTVSSIGGAALLEDEIEDDFLPPLIAQASVEAEVAAAFGDLEVIAQRSSLAAVRAGEKTAERVALDLLSISPARFDRLGSFVVSMAINDGRQEGAVVHQSEISHAIYSAIMDKKTCEVCGRYDGRSYDLGGDDEERYQTPSPDCRGGQGSCRCITVYVSKSEAKSSR